MTHPKNTGIGSMSEIIQEYKKNFIRIEMIISLLFTWLY